MDEDDIGSTVAESSESVVSLEEALLLLGIPNNNTGWDRDG